MAGIIFPTDLQQVEPQDDTLLLGADTNDIARNIKASDLVDYVKSNVPLDELAETISEQQATISEQQAAANEQAQTIAQLVATQSAPALETELAAGKTDLASAITAKGVQTAPTDSLAAMADNVREIVQETTTISGGEFYPQNMLGSSVWNLFQVAAMVKSQYISSGRYAGAIVAQYYKGYATLDLTSYGGGYAACLTCDGDFYANDGEHTAIGVHTWHDDDTGKVDRYVVFLWLEDNYTFQSLSSGVCPREIVVVGTCASIQINYNRLVQLYAPAEFGELKNFRLAGSDTPQGNWAAMQIWQNYKEHMMGTIFQNNSQIIYAEFTNLERVGGGILFEGTDYNAFANLNSISFPNLTEASAAIIANSRNYPNAFNNLSFINLPKLRALTGNALIIPKGGQSSMNNLQELYLPSLETISNGARLIICSPNSSSKSLTKLKTIRLPNLISINGYICSDDGAMGIAFCMNAVEKIDLSSLKYVTGGGALLVRDTALNAVTEIKIQSLEEVTGNGTFMSIGFDLNSNNGFNALEHISFDSLRICSGQGLIRSSFGNGANTSLKKLARIELPAIESANNTTLGGTFPALEYIYVGYTDNDRTLTVNLNGAAPLLTDIELKDGYCKNLTCSSYTALTAENIVAHILNRLGVNQAYLDEPTNANKLTITLGATNLAKLTDEEKQIAIDKGFTLA